MKIRLARIAKDYTTQFETHTAPEQPEQQQQLHPQASASKQNIDVDDGVEIQCPNPKCISTIARRRTLKGEPVNMIIRGRVYWKRSLWTITTPLPTTTAAHS